MCKRQVHTTACDIGGNNSKKERDESHSNIRENHNGPIKSDCWHNSGFMICIAIMFNVTRIILCISLLKNLGVFDIIPKALSVMVVCELPTSNCGTTKGTF